MSGLPFARPCTGRASALTTRAALASVAMALFLIGLKAWAALADVVDGDARLARRQRSRPARQHRRPARRPDRRPARRHRPPLRPRQGGIAGRDGPGRADHRFGAVHRHPLGPAPAGRRRDPARRRLGIAVSVVAIVATFALLAYQRHVVRRTGSVAIATDRLHYASDLLLNASVIAALVLDQYLGVVGADAVFGLLIALWLVRSAWKASSQAIDQLMDREWPRRGTPALPCRCGRISRAGRTSRPSHANQRHAPFRPVPRLGSGRLDGPRSPRPHRQGRPCAAAALPRHRNPHPPRSRRAHGPRRRAPFPLDGEGLMRRCPFSRSMPSPTGR